MKMNTDTKSIDKSSFDQKSAEQVARLFNVTFNSAALYGGDHPTTKKNAIPFAQTIVSLLQNLPSISIITDRGSLYVEDCCIDKVINAKRIVMHYEKIALYSLTFLKGVQEPEIEEVIKLTTDTNKTTNVTAISESLLAKQIKTIKCNYIRYGRITTDQQIVDSSFDPHAFQSISLDGASTVPNSVKSDNTAFSKIAASTIEELEQIVSLKKFLEKPKESISEIKESLTGGVNTQESAQKLAILRKELNNPNLTENSSVEALLDAVFELKVDLQEAIEIQKATGKLLSTEPVTNEMDSLTIDVLVKVVRDEYNCGAISIKRLAQLIRRMIPNAQELKRMLPKLKDGLLHDGMQLGDYLNLVKELRVEMEGENVADTLRDAAEQVGATVDELITAIKNQPGDAARLIVLASEIRNGVEQDDSQLSSILTDYIERVSSQIAATSHETSSPDGGKILRKIIAQVQTQLIDKLKTSGVGENVLSEVKEQLCNRFDKVLESAAAKWMENIIPTGRNGNVNDIVKLLDGVVEQESQLSRMKDPLAEALQNRGFSQTQIDEFFKATAQRIREGSVVSPMPNGVLNKNNLFYFLDREIKQHIRYKTPFSMIILSIIHEDPFGESRILTKDEISEFMPKICSFGKSLLRELDFISAPGIIDPSTVLILLTMTEAQNATHVERRVCEKIMQNSWELNGQKVYLKPLCTAVGPDETVANLKTFLLLVKKSHENLLKKIKMKV